MEGGWRQPDHLKGTPGCGLTRGLARGCTFLEQAALQHRLQAVLGHRLGSEVPWVMRTYR